jgi:type II secretory pathway predicted ATPase ExeA
MYQTYWGLRAKPFGNRLDADRYYPAPTHDEALARLDYLVDSERRLGLVMGPAGCGKSYVLEVLARQLARKAVRVGRLSLLGIEPAEMLWRIAVQWGLDPHPSATPYDCWRALGQRLIEHRWQGLRSVLLLDDAGQAAPELLWQVCRLVRSAQVDRAGLTVVLASRPKEVKRLGTRLLELAELRIEIEPWDLTDTAAYLEHALGRAGRTEGVFDPDAVVRLHELSSGAVGRIELLADLALLAAAGRGLPGVDADTIQGVYEELGFMDQAIQLGRSAVR